MKIKLGGLGLGVIGGFCGLLQLFVILIIESHETEEPSGVFSSDTAFPIFAVLITTEIMCVMALSMYRVAPWVAHLLGDDWEERRISAGKKKYGLILQRTTVAATVLRRLVVMIDAGAFSTNLLFSLSIALAPLLLPKPKL